MFYFDKISDVFPSRVFEPWLYELNQQKSADIYQKIDKDCAKIFIQMPGVSKDNLDIEQENVKITIKAIKRFGDIEEKIEKSFSITKGFDAASLEAKLADGILTLTIAKKQPETTAKKILVI
jgi:HSP20 family molecular chaperone IbpA